MIHHWDGIAPLTRGCLVALDGETLPHIVLECEDDKGVMPHVLVQALNTGMSIAPQERVAREFIKPISKP